MSQNQRPSPALFTQVDITAGPSVARSSDAHTAAAEQTAILKGILAAQDRQNELLEEMLSQMTQMQKQRNSELMQWKQANPQLAEGCRQAAETLSKVQIEFLHSLTNEVTYNAESLSDSEFMLNEFVDRFGPRLAHLNGVLQVLAQLAGSPPASGANQS